VQNQKLLPVYLSITMPHLSKQEEFIAGLEKALMKNRMTPKTLGRSEWSFEAPLIPIRKLIDECNGTIVIAMARTLIKEGTEYIGGGHEQKFFDRYFSTVWIQIETAMAFQVNHPILVLKEDVVNPEGILDPANSGLFVRTFSLSGESSKIPENILDILPAFRKRVEEYVKTKGKINQR
jgi:hypothetical protein